MLRIDGTTRPVYLAVLAMISEWQADNGLPEVLNIVVRHTSVWVYSDRTELLTFIRDAIKVRCDRARGVQMI